MSIVLILLSYVLWVTVTNNISLSRYDKMVAEHRSIISRMPLEMSTDIILTKSACQPFAMYFLWPRLNVWSWCMNKNVCNMLKGFDNKHPEYPQLIYFEDFEYWSEFNKVELDCIFAETGADREFDFVREYAEEQLYEKYNILSK